MKLSGQQQKAMEAVRAWIESETQQVFRLWGYAGTGKTTIAKELSSLVGGDVRFAAFTGKAASVLAKKGCFPASTIHRLIYVPHSKCVERLERLEAELSAAQREVPPPEKEIRRLERAILVESDRVKSPGFTLNRESDLHGASLLILDEVSMVGKEMAKDLLKFRVPVLCLGDPAQLPPVGSAGWLIKGEPDYLLTEIHRQASGSPVLQLARQVRSGERLEPCVVGDSRVVEKGELTIEDVASFDQVICGTNKARRDLNRQIRRQLGYDDPFPQEGDKLIALRNNHERGLLNGSQWEVQHVERYDDRLWMTIHGDGNSQVVTAFAHYFEGREREIRPWEMREAEHFDFGYAITCHRAQGSEWDNVLVIDESRIFRANARKWLYTAITRAADSVTVVLS